MSYTIKWRPQALDELRKLPRDVAQRIVQKIDATKENPMHFLERLADDPGYKIRAGDYRAIIDVLGTENLLIIRTVGHRRNIYKGR